LHVHPGVPHAFDIFTPDCALTRRAMSDRFGSSEAFDSAFLYEGKSGGLPGACGLVLGIA